MGPNFPNRNSCQTCLTHWESAQVRMTQDYKMPRSTYSLYTHYISFCIIGGNKTVRIIDSNEIRSGEEPAESSSEPGASTAVCARVQCAYEATCAVDQNGQPRYDSYDNKYKSIQHLIYWPDSVLSSISIRVTLLVPVAAAGRSNEAGRKTVNDILL